MRIRASTILGSQQWNVFELRVLMGIVSNDLMERCKAETTGRDVVLSGFFSSMRIFENHKVEDPIIYGKRPLPSSGSMLFTWPTDRSSKCPRGRRSAS